MCGNLNNYDIPFNPSKSLEKWQTVDEKHQDVLKPLQQAAMLDFEGAVTELHKNICSSGVGKG